MAYHGWNEGTYLFIGLGYREHFWVPEHLGQHYYSVPPLTSYILWASTSAFGLNIWALRGPSLVAEGLALVGLFFLARRLYGAPVARGAAVLFATLPWTLIWFGRGQTDPHFVGLALLAFALILHHDARRWCLPAGAIVLGVAGLAKQPAIFVLPILALLLASSDWTRAQKWAWARRFAAWMAVGALPVLAYYALQLYLRPDEVIAAYLFEAGQRTPPFANLPRNVAFGLVAGASPLVLAAAALGFFQVRPWIRDPFALWAIVFGSFVLLRTPFWHDYYTLVLMPPIAVFAVLGAGHLARWWQRRGHAPSRRPTAGALVAALAATALLTAIPVMGETGDLGDKSSERAVAALLRIHGQAPDVPMAVVTDASLALRLGVWMPGLAAPDQFDAPVDPIFINRYFDDRAPAGEIENWTAAYERAYLLLDGPGWPQPLYPEYPIVEEIDYHYIRTSRTIWIQQIR